jgi:hypothetical protein
MVPGKIGILQLYRDYYSKKEKRNVKRKKNTYEKPGNHEKRILEESLESDYNNVKAFRRKKDVVTLSCTVAQVPVRAGVTAAT